MRRGHWTEIEALNDRKAVLNNALIDARREIERLGGSAASLAAIDWALNSSSRLADQYR
jgi:hypothetical protein